ncbi:hypothetical protein COB18_01045 [Candidatus Kaiserbacteria bacterium]|nr:MAG: hypothetical protein COB18_01045 [Candidatus Kaiserbacteria bacterium]
MKIEFPKPRLDKTIKENDLQVYSGEPLTHSEESSEDSFKLIQLVVSDKKRFIDKGGAGTVHRVAPGICLKAMQDRHTREDSHIFDLGAPPHEEAHFLYYLNNFKVAGVRSPKYLGFIAENRKGGNAFIFMEELEAVSLVHAINPKSKVELPKNFDVTDAFSRLEEYFLKLHKEKKIAHGDIAARNIMIDKKTGLPFVIDFGRAVSFAGGKSARTSKSNPRKDLEDLEGVEVQVRQYLKHLTKV